MRDVPASITAAWRSGDFIGDRRPIARVTVQHPTMKLRNYTLMSTFSFKKVSAEDSEAPSYTDTDLIDPTKGQKIHNRYADFLFSKLGKPLEIPNVRSVSWNRSIDSDVADCTIETLNTKPTYGSEKPDGGAIDHPGYYTYSRGATSFSPRWQHTRNEWFGMLMPDNLIRTYEGYGWTPDQPPEEDPKLVQTGLWIIDTVTMNAQGGMTIKCRDVGRILMDQMYYSPVVPKDFYGRAYSNWDGKFEGDSKTVDGKKLRVSGFSSSNTPWIGSGTVQGHQVVHAFDDDPTTYWLSIGNDRPSRRFAYEWVECMTGNQSVSAVKVRAKKKGYTCYVSVRVNNKWQGATKINYHEDGIGKNGSDIAYVATAPIGTEDWVTIKLPKTYEKVQNVRVTFGNLQNFRIGTYKYRAGIRDVQVIGGDTTTKGSTSGYKKGPVGSNFGKYDDYTDLIKLWCGWAGFFWPTSGKMRTCDVIAEDGTVTKPSRYRHRFPAKPDPVLGAGVPGRIWGDFQLSGTNGPAALEASNFDKKSLMDCILYVRDILGFLFMIDESGGVVWRMPNIYNRGCMVSTLSEKPGRTLYVHPIDEKTVIMELDASLDSKNVREAYFVGNYAGNIGATAPGFNPNPTGLRRIGGWTDQGFKTQRECELMADMLSLRQLFTYRTDRIKIPANPAIQIDDQLRVNERVTAEGYLHYVKTISSNLDMQAGTWTYDLETFWLGEDPRARWLYHPEKMTNIGRGFLGAQGPLVRKSDNADRREGAAVPDDQIKPGD